MLFYQRTGHFQSMWEFGFVSTSSGRITVESKEVIPFAIGAVNEGVEYTPFKPCPAGSLRVLTYDAAAIIAGTPRVGSTTVSDADARNVIVNPFAVKELDRQFALSLLQIVADRRLRAELLAACKGSGRALIPQIKEKSELAFVMQ